MIKCKRFQSIIFLQIKFYINFFILNQFIFMQRFKKLKFSRIKYYKKIKTWASLLNQFQNNQINIKRQLVFEVTQMNEQAYIQIQDIFMKIQDIIASKQSIKSIEAQVTRQLNKIRNLINTNRNQLNEDQKNHFNNKQKKIKQTLQKMKPLIPLKPEERNQYREQILNVVKNVIEKKIANLFEKKDNKKRQSSIEFFKYHQTKLAMFADWLLSPSRKFTLEHMKSLVKYLNDLHISHEDKIFEDELKELYQKIVFTAEQTHEMSHEMFLSSYNHRPKINDYLLPKQTKENTTRNSICPTYKMIDLSIMPKMSKQLLFLMFYFHKGEIQQYLAAKELMANSWRYYNKFSIWLKRNSQANIDPNNEYETGNYYCYGAELSMKQRRQIKVYHRYLVQEI